MERPIFKTYIELEKVGGNTQKVSAAVEEIGATIETLAEVKLDVNKVVN